MSDSRVRPARLSDVPALNALYNHYVEVSPATFDIEPTTDDQRTTWFGQFAETGRHRLLLAEEGGSLLGYACSHDFRYKRAYETSVETTVYVGHDAGGRGVGASLYGALFEALAGEDLHRAYAGITLPNDASVALHERFGFRPIGTFQEVGRKFGRYWSVRWYEKQL